MYQSTKSGDNCQLTRLFSTSPHYLSICALVDQHIVQLLLEQTQKISDTEDTAAATVIVFVRSQHDRAHRPRRFRV